MIKINAARALPKSRPTTMSVMSCARKITSEEPPLPPSAARAVAALRTNAGAAQEPTRTLWRAHARMRSEQVMEGRPAAPQAGTGANCSAFGPL